MRFKHLRRLLPIVTAVLVLIYLFQPQRLLLQQLFPRVYWEEVQAVAEAEKLDPYLLLAVMREESGFDAAARSSAGAVGLMQLMPDTAAWLASLRGEAYAEADLLVPKRSIELGGSYIAWLLRAYRGSTPCAVAAYNAGSGRVDGWLAEGIWDGTVEARRDIPYAETRGYLRRVLQSYAVYRYLYAGADFVWI